MSAGESELHDMILDHLCEEHPESVADLADAEISRRIHLGIDRAASHGLTTEGAAVAFVSLMFLVAPDFDRHPKIEKALADSQHPPDERIRRLFSSTTENDWAEAAERSKGWRAVE